MTPGVAFWEIRRNGSPRSFAIALIVRGDNPKSVDRHSVCTESAVKGIQRSIYAALRCGCCRIATSIIAIITSHID